MAVPSTVAGIAPRAKRRTTARSSSPRLHQIRDRLPIVIATVKTGTAERRPTTQATSGSMMIPVPNPATPPTSEPTSAPTTRTAQPMGSGMSCHHTRVSRWLAAAGALLVSLDSMMNITSPALAVAGAPAALRGRRLGFLSGAMGLGFLGSLPAGLLVESVGWRAVFHVRVPLALIVLVWAFATRSEAVELERKPMLLGDVTR